jgi:hypothetical protein
MKDCTIFLKLQEAALSKQTEAKRQGYEGNGKPSQINKGTMELLKDKTSQTRDMMMAEGTFHLRGTSQQ